MTDNTIRIGFTTQIKSPVSWLVRKLTKSQCSHAIFVYFDKDWQTDMVMEAADVGFRLISLEKFKKSNEIIALIAPPVDIDVGFKYVGLEYLGTMFDYFGLLGNGPILLGRWLKRKWHNPWNSPKSLFCSEAVVVALQKSGVPGADVLVPQDTTPQDLMDFMQGKL